MESNCGSCNKADHVENMVACDECNIWYHLSCAGVNKTIEEREFICKDCSARKFKASTKTRRYIDIQPKIRAMSPCHDLEKSLATLWKEPEIAGPEPSRLVAEEERWQQQTKLMLQLASNMEDQKKMFIEQSNVVEQRHREHIEQLKASESRWKDEVRELKAQIATDSHGLPVQPKPSTSTMQSSTPVGFIIE